MVILLKRYLIIFQGRVQGVGFRSFIHMQALKFNCTGWARNLDNGNVEAALQGEEENILKIIRTIRQGNTFIRVDDYFMRQVPPEIHETSFLIKY